MTDPLEFGLDILGCCYIAVRKMPEIELHGGLQAPFKRNLVDGDRALATIHGGSEMPGRVEMCRAMSRKPDPFDRPAFAVRQVFFFQVGKKFQDVARRILM